MAKQAEFELEPFDPQTSADPEAAAVVWTPIKTDYARKYFWNSVENAKDLRDSDKVLAKDPAWNRRCVLALCDVADYLVRQRERVAAQAESETERYNLHLKPGWEQLHMQMRAFTVLASALLRRKLPLERDDVLRLLAAASDEAGRFWLMPFSSTHVWIIKQLENASEQLAGDEAVAEAIGSWRRAVSHSYDAKKLLPRVDAVLAAMPGEGEADPADIVLPAASPPKVAAGSASRLVELKQQLGLLPPDDVATETVGLDAFPLREDSPLRSEHEAITATTTQWCEATAEATRQFYEDVRVRNVTSSKPEMIEERCGGIIERLIADGDVSRLKRAVEERKAVLKSANGDGVGFGEPGYYIGQALDAIAKAVADEDESADRDSFFDALLATFSHDWYLHDEVDLDDATLDQVEAFDRETSLSDGERHVVWRAICNVLDHPPAGTLTPVLARAMRLVFGRDTTLLLVPGEHWADEVHGDLAKATPKQRAAWIGLLKHAMIAEASRPTAKWQKEAKEHVKAIQPAKLRQQVGEWFAVVPKGRSIQIRPRWHGGGGSDFAVNDGNATVLKGLVWTLAAHADTATPRVVAELLLTCLKKVPGVGPRCVKVANACIWALGEMAKDKRQDVRDAALAQLARLKARVTFRTTLKAIEKVLDAAAAEAGMSKDALEELGTPAFGFERGERRETLGGADVVLRLDGNKVTTTWTNDKGKPVKLPPATVKREHKDELKELKQAAKDAEGVVAATKNRLDKLYLDDRSWTLAEWRERYLHHGLVGTIARRLIWSVDETPVLFDGDVATDATGNSVAFGETAEVRLWHPIGTSTDEVVRWRERLASLEITQPFKQAHREVYLLTDAERNTGTYSNRFAGHVLKQHQFNALCASRGWRNQLRLLVDDSYAPPLRELPAHGLRAEYWVEGIGEDYGNDTNESGVYHHLATDQVRFYQTGAATNYQHAGGGAYETYGADDVPENHPLPLEQIPPLVLSEVLRDCDLFVGVTSVGNDPAWQDGGRVGGFADYWHDFSFGDLSQTAKTRKAVLEKLVPRLKIRERCSFSDKFLVVRGDRRTYKIHLGSGNILMEPNDAYLCIVPDRRAESATGGGFLPFEGDRTMSVIVSKALLLADDTTITDPTIVSQISSQV
jgi:hypothetical protein